MNKKENYIMTVDEWNSINKWIGQDRADNIKLRERLDRLEKANRDMDLKIDTLVYMLCNDAQIKRWEKAWKKECGGK
jgi:hypothetical protein